MLLSTKLKGSYRKYRNQSNLAMHSKRLRSKKTRVAANEILRSRNKISTMRVVKPEYILLKKK